MKKVIIWATLLFSIISVASTKEDYQKALADYAKTKNVSEFETSLKKIVNNKSDEYTREATIALATINLQKNKMKDAEVYATKILNDKNATNNNKELAYKIIYNTYNTNPSKRVEIIEKLIAINPTNQEYMINQISDNIINGDKTKADNLYSKYIKDMYLDERANFNSQLVANLIQKDLLTEARKYVNLNLDLNLKTAKVSGNYYKSIISKSENKIDDAIKYAKEADKISKGQDASIKNLLINIYDLSGKKDEALQEAINLKKLSPTVETYFNIIVLAEKYNKSNIADETVKELKLVISPEEAANIDYQIALAFLEGNNDKIAAKYAQKLINDKKYDGYLILAKIAIKNGDRAEALKQVGLAKKYNVEGAAALEKQILTMN